MALVEAKSSRSRGVRTIKAGLLGGPTAGLWLMLELELEAEEVCGLVQDRLMFCATEREGVCSWRILKTLSIPALAGSHSRPTDPPAIGRLSKSVIEWDWYAQATINGNVIEHERWAQGWAFRDEFKLSLPTIAFDHCMVCQTYRRLLNGMCYLCWNVQNLLDPEEEALPEWARRSTAEGLQALASWNYGGSPHQGATGRAPSGELRSSRRHASLLLLITTRTIPGDGGANK